MFGFSATTSGVVGSSLTGFGVPGSSPSGTAVTGNSVSGFGVLGLTESGIAVQGTAFGEIGIAVQGSAAGSSAVAGLFEGPVVIDGDVGIGGGLTVHNKNFKAAAVPFPDGSQRLLYCMESPEIWFEDFGSAKLRRGRATVKLSDFANVIVTSDYRVFLSPEGDCNGLYVAHKRGAAFEVRELGGGTSRVAFSYRIVGRRKDIKGHRRFAKFQMPVLPKPPKVVRLPPMRAPST